jgi:DNA-binding IclR family transcriptional regulator
MFSSLHRALTILEAFAAERPELGITEVAEAVGMPKSTVHRVLSALEGRGYLRKNLQTGKYRLGSKLWELGTVMVNSLNLRGTSRPYLEELAERTGETINLTVLDGADSLYIDEIQSRFPLRAHSYVGIRAPAHCVATGKAMLAHLPSAFEGRVQAGLPRFTEETIVDRTALERELALVREQGYAINREEWRAGVCAAAAPIRDHTNQVVAALGVSGPATRLTRERLHDLGALVKDLTAKLSVDLGCRL